MPLLTDRSQNKWQSLKVTCIGMDPEMPLPAYAGSLLAEENVVETIMKEGEVGMTRLALQFSDWIGLCLPEN